MLEKRLWDFISLGAWILAIVLVLLFFFFQIAYIERSRNMDYGTQIRDMAYTTAIDVLEEFADYSGKARGVIRLVGKSGNPEDVRQQVVDKFNELMEERLQFWVTSRNNMTGRNVELEYTPVKLDANVDIGVGIDPEEKSGTTGFYTQYGENSENLEGNKANEVDYRALPYISTTSNGTVEVQLKGGMITNSHVIGGKAGENMSLREEYLEDGIKFKFNLFAQLQHRIYNDK